MSENFEAGEIVSAIYRTLLLREPDTEGLAMASAHLRDTHVLEDLLKGVLYSAEFKSRLPMFLDYYHPTSSSTDQGSFANSQHAFHDPELLDAHLRAHPALGDDILARLGEPIVKLKGPKVYRSSIDADRNELSRIGVRIQDFPVTGDVLVVVDEEATPFSLEIRAQGHANNLVVLGPECTIHGEVLFGGTDNVVYLGGYAGHPQTYRAAMYTHGSAFVFGHHSTSVGSSFHIEGPCHHLVVGRDCMFSADVYVAGTDNHALIVLETGEVMNLADNLTVGPHAWLGFGATVLKGANVGEGSVLASRSVLTGPSSPHTLMAGSPARLLRENISWDRDFPSVVDARRRARSES